MAQSAEQGLVSDPQIDGAGLKLVKISRAPRARAGNSTTYLTDATRSKAASKSDFCGARHPLAARKLDRITQGKERTLQNRSLCRHTGRSAKIKKGSRSLMCARSSRRACTSSASSPLTKRRSGCCAAARAGLDQQKTDHHQQQQRSASNSPSSSRS